MSENNGIQVWHQPVRSWQRVISCAASTLVCLLASFVMFCTACLAAPSSEVMPEKSPYVPSVVSSKDQENLDFFEDVIEQQLRLSDAPESDDELLELTSKEMLLNEYYSPDSSVKKIAGWARLPCKISWVSRTRGVDLVDSILKDNEVSDSDSRASQIQLYKTMYEHFCPALW